ncbi:MAG: ribokinase [Bacteroides sp.]|nr:ribokinase [Bacteroides sp.]
MICCIGHITHDRVITHEFTSEMPGGTAYYFAKALNGIAPGKFRIVTAVGNDELPAAEQLKREGVLIDILPSRKSVFFENKYGENKDERTQRVLAKADPFSVEMVKDLNADYIHLGTLLADDFDLEVIKYLSTKGKVSVDIQGYLRRVVGEEVIHQDYAQKREAMRYISVLKANEQEMEVLTGSSDPLTAARILSDWGCEEVVLTFGSKGSLVRSHGENHEIPAYPATRIIDTTGCGDTYMAGYLYRRNEGDDIDSAGRYAAAMCSLKLSCKGPLTARPEDISLFI